MAIGVMVSRVILSYLSILEGSLLTLQPEMAMLGAEVRCIALGISNIDVAFGML